jgi:hypothetical protein
MAEPQLILDYASPRSQSKLRTFFVDAVGNRLGSEVNHERYSHPRAQIGST